ncbi:MAG: hypothetical protein MUO58_10180 [Anaerolineales bacterium]|nr:hypothetical protein [Anaerolineales bacterium]
MLKHVRIPISPLKEIKFIVQWLGKLFGVSMLLVACAGPPPPTEKVELGEISAVTLPPSRPSEMPSLPEVEISPTNAAQNTLEDVLASYGLERWIPGGGDQSRYPISAEILSNPATYGAFLDVLELILGAARIDTETIAAQGGQAFIEIYWNGVSSYSGGPDVDIIYRGAVNPEVSLWVRDEGGSFSLLDVGDLGPLIKSYPADVPIEWQNPGYLLYIDDPWDHLARGLHILDAEGRAIALWDRERSSFEPWMEVGPLRFKIVNGRDVDYYGFSEEQLDVLWEAFAWINIDREDMNELFEAVASVRSTDLPEWIAGAAGSGDIRVDPLMFMHMRDIHNAPRQADVLWIAALLIHEAVHVTQPGECSPEYAASQSMSFTEYGLFIETGPGQAYEQQVRFMERILNLEDEAGYRMVKDQNVRRTIQGSIEYYGGALGRSDFPNGDPVPTCADP